MLWIAAVTPAYSGFIACYRANDAYVRSDKPDENFDNYYLYHGRKSSDTEYLCFIKFDLSPIPEFARIEEARLEYHIATFKGESVDDTYFMMLAEEWSEYGITYNEHPVVIENVAVSTEWSRQDWVNIDCTEFVRRWYEGEVENNGVIGRVSEGEDECWYRVYSREYGDEGTNPRLLVEYSIVRPDERDTGEVTGSTGGDVAVMELDREVVADTGRD